jgi:lysophospholipase L1-like esterase
MRRLFREMERQYRNVQVFDPAVVLCDSKRCGDIAPHQVFYKGDGNHLSAAGADLVGRELEQFIATKVLARDRSDHRAAK